MEIVFAVGAKIAKHRLHGGKAGVGVAYIVERFRFRWKSYGAMERLNYDVIIKKRRGLNGPIRILEQDIRVDPRYFCEAPRQR